MATLVDATGDSTQSAQSRTEALGRAVELAQELEQLYANVAPNGRRKSLALTHLENAQMWFVASVMRG